MHSGWRCNWIARVVLVIALLAGSVGATAAPTAQQLARQGIDQVLNLEFEQARATFDTLEEQFHGYPLLPFLRASVDWAESEAHVGPGHDEVKKRALTHMLDSAELSKTMLKREPDNHLWLLNQGLSKFFAARLYADMSQPIMAYRFGRGGRDDLREVIEQDPGMDDAYLALGMYEYIAGSIPRGLRWLAALFDLNGDRDKGVRYLQQATTHAPVLAPEAARMMLVAAGFEPEVFPACTYLRLAQYARNRYPANPHYSLALQLLYVNCGYPQRALAELRHAENSYLERFPNLAEELESIRIFIYRDLGDLERIRSMKSKFPKDQDYWRLIMAQTYDIRGQRDQALAIYNDLFWKDVRGEEFETDSGPPEDWIIDRAKKYRKQPYKLPRPEKLDPNNMLMMQGVTAAGR